MNRTWKSLFCACVWALEWKENEEELARLLCKWVWSEYTRTASNSHFSNGERERAICEKCNCAAERTIYLFTFCVSRTYELLHQNVFVFTTCDYYLFRVYSIFFPFLLHLSEHCQRCWMRYPFPTFKRRRIPIASRFTYIRIHTSNVNRKISVLR